MAQTRARARAWMAAVAPGRQKRKSALVAEKILVNRAKVDEAMRRIKGCASPGKLRSAGACSGAELQRLAGQGRVCVSSWALGAPAADAAKGEQGI